VIHPIEERVVCIKIENKFELGVYSGQGQRIRVAYL